MGVFLFIVAVVIIILLVRGSVHSELNKEQINETIASISGHKKEIEKYAFNNGTCIEGYEGVLANHFSQLFHLQKKLSHYQSNRYDCDYYPEKPDHAERKKLIEIRLKDKTKGFYGGLYNGELYHIYNGIGECSNSHCHNSLTEDWHSLCKSCYNLREYM